MCATHKNAGRAGATQTRLRAFHAHERHESPGSPAPPHAAARPLGSCVRVGHARLGSAESVVHVCFRHPLHSSLPQTPRGARSASSRFEQQHRHLPDVEVCVMPLLVRHVRTKVAADEAVPHAVVLPEHRSGTGDVRESARGDGDTRGLGKARKRFR